MLDFLVAKRSAMHRGWRESPWTNALEISIYTGVETDVAADVLRRLTAAREDVAYRPASPRADRAESWCLMTDDSLVFLDARRAKPGSTASAHWLEEAGSLSVSLPFER